MVGGAGKRYSLGRQTFISQQNAGPLKKALKIRKSYPLNNVTYLAMYILWEKDFDFEISGKYKSLI
jgi:hypothetical protein